MTCRHRGAKIQTLPCVFRPSDWWSGILNVVVVICSRARPKVLRLEVSYLACAAWNLFSFWSSVRFDGQDYRSGTKPEGGDYSGSRIHNPRSESINKVVVICSRARQFLWWSGIFRPLSCAESLSCLEGHSFILLWCPEVLSPRSEVIIWWWLWW